MSKTESVGIHLKHVHRHMRDIGVCKMSVSVITTTSSDDNDDVWKQPNVAYHVVECSASRDVAS